MQRTIIADPKAALTQARQLLASDPAAAAAQARNLLKSDPDHPAALRLLAQALRRLDQPDEAARAERDAYRASTREPAHQAVAQAVTRGNPDQAVDILRQLLTRDQSDVLAWVMLGVIASNGGKFEIAEPPLRRAVELAPDEPSPRLALAELLQRSRRPALALAEIDRLDPDTAASATARSLRAEIYSALGRLDEELALLEPLHAASPDPAQYGLRIGHALRSLGRNDDAVDMYRSILAQIPTEGTSWWSLANLKTVKFTAADLAVMTHALAQPGLVTQNRIRLNFALGKAREDQGDAAAAFGHYAAGNRLRSTIASYDRTLIGDWVDNSIATFTPDVFAARAGHGAAARDPIFIIGLQRSGSTLVEQVLASHPMIEGTAELTDLPNLARQLGEEAGRAGRHSMRHLIGLPAERLRALGEAYLDASRVHRVTDRPLFTDKMPNNWLYLGLIRLILPNARIIDVRRDPMACCFSNWKQLYARGLEHSNALDTMGKYYADYVRMMRHFDAVQRGMVHRIIYDDLVEDLEGSVRHMLDYLGLPFDPACLDFHANDRAVRTISAGQVRQPINRGGIGQWKPFDAWLGPLRDALGDTLATWRQ